MGADTASLDDNQSCESRSLQPPLAYKETVAVKRSKWLVITVLISAIVVATLIYYVASGDERDSFERDVSGLERITKRTRGNAFFSFQLSTLCLQAKTFESEINDNAKQTIRDYVGVLQSFSTSMTSNAISGNQTWPNVTIPFFEIRAHEAKQRVTMDIFMVAPFVKEADRLGWEAYATANQGWLGAGLDYQELENVDPGAIPKVIHPFSNDTSMGGHDSYLPLWQIGPAPSNASIVNLDLLSHSHIRTVVERVLETGKAELSPITDVRFLIEHSNTKVDGERRRMIGNKVQRNAVGHGSREAEEAKDGSEQSKSSSEGKNNDEDDAGGYRDLNEPRALIVQPVFATFEKNATIAGFVIATFSWEYVFANDDVIRGMTVVLSDSCHSQFTYQINRLAKFRGEGDFHDKKYDYLKRHEEFEPFKEESEESSRKLHDESECKVRRTISSLSQ
jgi:CHASE domain